MGGGEASSSSIKNEAVDSEKYLGPARSDLLLEEREKKLALVPKGGGGEGDSIIRGKQGETENSLTPY